MSLKRTSTDAGLDAELDDDRLDPSSLLVIREARARGIDVELLTPDAEC